MINIMQITFDLEEVDYIALCPGYTSRLLHRENTYETLNDTTRMNKVQMPERGYNVPYTALKRVTTEGGPEMKFWALGHWDRGESYRRYQDDITNCPNYIHNNYTSVTDYTRDFGPVVKPVLIMDLSGVFILDDEGEEIIDDFFPKFRNAFNGSIVFASSNKNYKLNMIDWVKLAKSIDIAFCGCYSPKKPSGMRVISVDNKSVLIVEFDCESG